MAFITMSVKELDRFQVIKKLIAQHINGTAAASLLGLSIRQIKRLKAKVLQHGAKGLIHQSRGKIGHNHLPSSERQKISDLVRKNYYDFGPTFAAEKLSHIHHINRDPKTIRQIMIDEGFWKPKIKKAALKHRAWRERKSCYGEMIQFDGSYEFWFENRGPKSCLLAAIDDATGKIVFAKFAAHEGVFPVFAFWQQYLVKNGKPRSIYLDKFSTYNLNHQLAKENNDTLTQFERAAQNLHIELIKANSPQAKGRVERLFGTLQDRLIKELRLENISAILEANVFLEKKFIPEFNGKFAVCPKSKTDLHQKLNAKEQIGLAGVFSRQTERTIQNDFTLGFKNQYYQLTEKQPATICKKDKVIVEEQEDGTIRIRLRGKYLNYDILPERPKKNNERNWVLPAGKSKAHKPSANHPWRHQNPYSKKLTTMTF